MEKDTKWETFFGDNRRYADIINGLGCGGEQLIQADDLQDADSRSGKRSRDILRKAALGMNFIIVGIENQEKIDYRMPFRNMAYDVDRYGKQLAEIRREVREQFEPESLMPGEYLYGFKKDSKLHPVITFVLYSGEEPWDGARSLHELLDFTDVPASLRNMTPDYKINVIEIRNLEHTEVFRTDVKQVFDFIRLSGDKEALLKQVESDDSYRHMDADAFDVIMAYTDSTELRKQMECMQQESIKKGEKKDMCKAIRDLIEDSKAEGREEGRILMLQCFFSNGGSEEDAVKMLAATREEIETARETA